MDTPTIGRIVTYRVRAAAGDYDAPAIITAVAEPRGTSYVNLTVFHPNSAPDVRQEVRHDSKLSRAGDYLGEQEPGTWRWPVRK